MNLTVAERERAAIELTHKTDFAVLPLGDQVRTAMQNYFRHLDGYDASGLYQMVISEIEPPLLETVMDYAQGNQTRASEILGISRSTLRKKLALYELD